MKDFQEGGERVFGGGGNSKLKVLGWDDVQYGLDSFVQQNYNANYI